MKTCRIISAFMLCALLLTGQTNRGGITGTVADSSGGVVPDATVVIKNMGTNQEFRVKTSAAGSFNVGNLDPVVYSVTAEAAGFKRETVENVKVDTAGIQTIDIKLQAGTVATTVEVQASAAIVNTESGTTSSTVTQREIQDLPLVNRSVLDLALTQPNVSGDAGSENPILASVTTCPGCTLSVNGGRPLSTQFLADGANNTGVSLSRTMVSFSPETVQEFTVQTTAYSAEYGTSGGGIINATTRSGTNQLNGTVLWYNRNPDFAAAPFTLASTHRSSPTLKYNQFSLAAGGPVYIPKIYDGRNKTFWFSAFEPNYRRDFLAQDALTQTDAMRQGDFSNTIVTSSGRLPVDVAKQFGLASTGDAAIYNQFSLVNGNQFVALPVPAAGTTYSPFPGNVIPKSLLDPVYVKSLKYYTPAGPYYIGASGGVFNLYNPRLLRSDEKRFTLKVDEIISSKDHVSVRYTSTPIIKTQYTPVTPTSDNADYSYAKQALVDYTRTVSPTMVNDMRLNYTRGNFSNTVAPQWDPLTGANINTELGLPSILHGGLPALPTTGGQGSTENQDHEDRYGLTNILYLNRGKMSFKIGGDVSKALQNVLPLYAAIGGVYAFSGQLTNSNGASNGTGGDGFATFELGVPSGITFRTATIPYYYRWWSGDAFIQDDWKIKPNLTLNIGLRYNLEMPRTEKYNNQGVFRPDLAKSFPLATPMTLADGSVLSSIVVPPFAYSGRGGNSRYLTPTDYKDYEPRFGFAWSPSLLRDRRVTVRGGYGLSHAPVSGANRLPSPDFGATSGAWNQNSGQLNTNYITRLGYNPPVVTPITPAQAISAPADGLLYFNSANSSLNSPGGGYAVSSNYHTPYVQNWNFTLSWQATSSTAVELSYVGSKGTHLFEGKENINPRNLNLLNAEEAQNINTNGTGTGQGLADPLGRVGTNGRVINIQAGTLGSPYVGFPSLYLNYDASANSHREAGYISVVHRGRGLTYSSNFTWGKSIDDASSSGGDKNVLSNVGGQVDGLVGLGASRSLDRSVSSYDQRFNFNNSVLYDLPFGRGRKFLTHSWKPVDWVAGGWTVTGIVRANSGFPATAVLPDSNMLGDPSETHTARPDIVPGVPLINPYWSRSCPINSNCQPYLNPSAFERPPVGALGDAPRTFDGVRGPWAQFFDMSVQKDFRFSEGGKRRLQFRVDFLNAFNHPVFRTYPNNAGGGGVDFIGAPSTATLSTSSYNSWAAANGQPAYSATAGAPGNVLYNQIVSNVNSYKNAAGVLPNNFYSIPLPANFYAATANSFDITTTQGYKLYQLRSSFGTSAFGDLYQPGQPRFIQFGLKLYF